MKKLLLAVLLACCQAVSAQIKIDLPEAIADKSFVNGQIKAAKSELKAYADSLFKAKGGDGGTQNPPNGLADCKRGPIPSDVYGITTTSATVLWDGEDVFGWDYSIYKGTERVALGSVKPTGNREPITYAGLSPGEYKFTMQGNTCKSEAKSITFTVPKPTGDNGTGGDGGNSGPPPVTKGKRSIIMNLTGDGFDLNSPTGITKDWLPRIEAFLNMSYNGKSFKGIDGIRVNMKWHDYEPKEGTFRDDKLLDIINYCKQRGLRLCIAIIPWRVIGDEYLARSEMLEHLPDPNYGPVQDLVWHDKDETPVTDKTYLPSFNSAIGRQKFKNAVRHLAEFMAKYPENVDYISTATSPGEEYETVIVRRANNQLLLTGYGQIDLDAWRNYSGGMPVPYPAQNNEEYISYLFSSEVGKKWYEFRTKGLKDFHAAFVQGVREGGKGKVRSMGMYAGVGAPSATWTGLYKLNDIFSAGTLDQPDIIYSSEGDAGTQVSKVMATDLNIGTFPGARYAIEFDPDDVSWLQNRDPSPTIDLNWRILDDWGRSFFVRGGEIIHFAMAFYEPKINQLAEGVWNLRKDFIESDAGMVGVAQGDHFTFPITHYNGVQEYRGMYTSRGGGGKKQVKIIVK
ncbi:hypothetical protein SAMN04487996_10798 [Dyadobacter soli]|uniref:Uncharacterized protein n=1 Tax=Dyadobacter soli TaxID=659014 RepID=A0A1G7G2F7_9BACT|nr:hypothetical protein [Dyadobacter soli]SDE82336.1 hypothetical protein SAMN04487996_10798 [Dyadobacter soli]